MINYSLRLANVAVLLFLSCNSFAQSGEKNQKLQKEETSTPERVIKQSGIISITEVNLAQGIEDYSRDFSYGAQEIVGYLLQPNFSVGFGFGVDKYRKSTIPFLPLFADIRGYFFLKPVTPFVSMAIGYSFCFDRGNKGGMIFNPSLGIKTINKSGSALSLSIGYRIQENTLLYIGPEFKERASFINMKLGFTVVSR